MSGFITFCVPFVSAYFTYSIMSLRFIHVADMSDFLHSFSKAE